MAQVGQQSVGEVDTGSAASQPQQGLARLQAGHRELTDRSPIAFSTGARQGSRTQLPRHEKVIAPPHAVPAQGATAWDPAQHVDRQARLSRPGKVPAHQGAAVDRGLAQQTPKESVETGELQVRWRSQGQGKCQRTRPHSGQIREIRDQGSATHAESGLLGPTKVDVLHGHVGTGHPVLSRPRTQDRRVVADTQHHAALVQAARSPSDAIDQPRFTQIRESPCTRHGGTIDAPEGIGQTRQEAHCPPSAPSDPV